MPELTHETTEDGFHEIQLSGKQLVFLFMATTVVSVVIFLCGVLVGRGVGAEGEPEQAIESSETEVPPGAEANAVVPPGNPPPVDETDLSYHERLQAQSSPKEDLKPQAEQPAPAPKPEPPAAATRQPVSTVQPAPPGVPTSGRRGTWVIQVQALSNQSAAGAIVQRLIAKGYPAFLLAPSKGAPVIYRVQIGRYDDRREAEQVARRLEKEEQFKPDIKR